VTPPPPPRAAPSRNLLSNSTAAVDRRRRTDEPDGANEKKPLTTCSSVRQVGFEQRCPSGLQKDADWMKRWMSTKITIEAHQFRGPTSTTAWRGRASATCWSAWVATARITVVSKGEEQPFAGGRRSCWALNRRSHFIVTAK
jgi:hypothetical protein